MLWPQFTYMALGIVALYHGLFGLSDVNISVRLANISVMLFFMFMVSGIVRAAFYGIEMPRIESPLRIRRRLGFIESHTVSTSGAD